MACGNCSTCKCYKPSEEYFAIFEKSDSGYGVSFPDFMGCISFGDTHEEAVVMAEEALSIHIAGMIEDGEVIRQSSTEDKIRANYLIDNTPELSLVKIKYKEY